MVDTKVDRVTIKFKKANDTEQNVFYQGSLQSDGH